MKVLLVQPDIIRNQKGFILPAMPEPLALEIIAAYIPHHDVKILDLRFGDTLQETLKSFNPDIVGVTSLTTDVYNARNVLKDAKEYNPAIVTVAGGMLASLYPVIYEEDFVDAIVLGEGDFTFRDLADTLQRKGALSEVKSLRYRDRKTNTWANTAPREERVVLSDSPIARRDLVNPDWRKEYYFLFDKPTVSIETARGCPFTCKFCSAWKLFGKKCRYMSPERVVDELETIDEDSILIVDDNFFADVKRAEAICRLMKQRGITNKTFKAQGRADTIAKYPEIIEKWAEVGLVGLLVGFETFKEEELENLNKKTTLEHNKRAVQVLHQYGVTVWGTFIINPNFTREDFKHLRDYVDENEITFQQYTVLTPLPGTDFFEEVRHQLTTEDFRKYDCVHAVIPTRLPIVDFYKEIARVYKPRKLSTTLKLLTSGTLSLREAYKGYKFMRRFTNYKTYLMD